MTDVRVIYKYRVNVGKDEVAIPWGPGTSVTGAVADADGITFWCCHFAPDELIERRGFRVVGTGQPFPPWNAVYATSRDERSGLVWHLIGGGVI